MYEIQSDGTRCAVQLRLILIYKMSNVHIDIDKLISLSLLFQRDGSSIAGIPLLYSACFVTINASECQIV